MYLHEWKITLWIWMQARSMVDFLNDCVHPMTQWLLPKTIMVTLAQTKNIFETKNDNFLPSTLLDHSRAPSYLLPPISPEFHTLHVSSCFHGGEDYVAGIDRFIWNLGDVVIHGIESTTMFRITRIERCLGNDVGHGIFQGKERLVEMRGFFGEQKLNLMVFFFQYYKVHPMLPSKLVL